MKQALYCDQILQAPRPIRNPSRHRGRDPKRGVDSDEVVIGEVQGQRGLQVLPLLGKFIRQPREPLAPLAKRSILAFDMRRAAPFHVGVAEYGRLFYFGYFTGAVAGFSAVFRLSIDLDYLAVIHAVRKAGIDGVDVWPETVCRNLEPGSCRRRAELRNEIIGRDLIALAEMPGENQFRVALDPDEGVGVANLAGAGFGWPLVALFFLNKSPDFICLYVGHFDVADVGFKQPFAVFASRQHQVDDRPLLNVRDTGGGPNRISLNEQMEDQKYLLFRQARFAVEQLLLRVSKALSALLAFPALNPICLSVKSGLHHVDPAVVARHCESPCDSQLSAT